MPSIRDTFEPYDPNKPIISIKPKSKEEILQMLISLIPGGRALKNMHDNPEGPATETLDLLAEDVVPGYYNVIKPLAKGEKVNVNDALKEAALIAMPVPKGTRGKPVVDKERTKEFNKLLSDKIDERSRGNTSWASEMKEKYASETPWTITDLEYSPVDNIKYPDDLILQKTNGTTDGVPSKTLGPDDLAGYMNSFPSHDILTQPDLHPYVMFDGSNLEKAYKNYEKDRILNKFLKDGLTPGIVDYYDPTKFRTTDRLNMGYNYDVTLGDLREAKKYSKERAARELITEFVFGEDGKYKQLGQFDALTRNIRNPEMRKDYIDLHNQYESVLKDKDLSRDEKITRLNGIINEIQFLRDLNSIK